MRTLVSARALAVPTAMLVLVLGVVAGCGASDDPAPAQPAPAATPTPTAELSVTPEPRPSVSASATPSPTGPPEGDGDADETDAPATAGGGICSDLEATAVGGVLGGTVRGVGLAPRGCEFTQSARTAPSATFVESSFAKTSGGMDGAKAEATSTVEGDPEDLSGIGTAAFVVTGTVFGGDQVQGAGAVRVGDRLIQVTLSQGRGLAVAQVRTLVVNLLKLAAAQAR